MSLHPWCHLAIYSSDTLFSFCPQSFQASGTFPMSQQFASGDQNIGVTASVSVLPMSIQGSCPSRLTGLIALLFKGLKSLLHHHSSKASIHKIKSRQHIINKQTHHFTTNVCAVKAMVFPVVMYRYESWTIKEAEHQRIDAFELWCSWGCKESHTT